MTCVLVAANLPSTALERKRHIAGICATTDYIHTYTKTQYVCIHTYVWAYMPHIARQIHVDDISV